MLHLSLEDFQESKAEYSIPVFGCTGAGKTTLLANLKGLEMERKYEAGTGDFYVDAKPGQSGQPYLAIGHTSNSATLYVKKVTVGNNDLKVDLIDMPGAKDNHSLPEEQMIAATAPLLAINIPKKTVAIMIVLEFDALSPSGAKGLPEFLADIAKQIKIDFKDVPIIFAITKIPVQNSNSSNLENVRKMVLGRIAKSHKEIFSTVNSAEEDLNKLEQKLTLLTDRLELLKQSPSPENVFEQWAKIKEEYYLVQEMHTLLQELNPKRLISRMLRIPVEPNSNSGLQANSDSGNIRMQSFPKQIFLFRSHETLSQENTDDKKRFFAYVKTLTQADLKPCKSHLIADLESRRTSNIYAWLVDASLKFYPMLDAMQKLTQQIAELDKLCEMKDFVTQKQAIIDVQKQRCETLNKTKNALQQCRKKLYQQGPVDYKEEILTKDS